MMPSMPSHDVSTKRHSRRYRSPPPQQHRRWTTLVILSCCQGSVRAFSSSLKSFKSCAPRGSSDNVVTPSPLTLQMVGSTSPSSSSSSSSRAYELQSGLSNGQTTKPDDTVETKTFGSVRRIRMEGESETDSTDDDDDDDDTPSFVGVMGVPTFATIVNQQSDNHDDVETSTMLSKYGAPQTTKRGLEGALGHDHGPAFVVDGVFSKDLCNDIIDDCERRLGGFGQFDCGRNHHGAMQVLVSQSMADAVGQRLAPHINVDDVDRLRRKMTQDERSYHIQNSEGTSIQNDIYAKKDDNEEGEEDVRMFFRGLNRRWRIYRYHPSGNEAFAPHIDASFPPSGLTDDGRSLVWDDSKGQKIVSRLTVLIYLSDDFVGGATNFYLPIVDDEKIPGSSSRPLPLLASVKPVTGSALLFPQGVGESAVEYARRHWPLHEGSPVLAGNSPKYVIRSDALFVEEREKPPFDDENKSLFQYDHLVRKTFSLKSRIFEPSYLSHANLLFNPHMGVENLGPLLYSFIRFTKAKRVCEIGAGYTSLWILQAMKDNDDEMKGIQSIQSKGQCRMLNIDWTIHSKVDDFNVESARLFCIDNCEHQKETATGARAVAKTLGLSDYFEFRQGDAFDLDFGTETLDLLWCDFGVGSRMKEFMSSAWKSIRPGGFLLCHSTTTNENTRMWLEAIRSRQPIEYTGILPDEYVELSLLEPHKRFQNSISILQKRRNENGEIFQEPIYSQYA